MQKGYILVLCALFFSACTFTDPEVRVYSWDEFRSASYTGSPTASASYRLTLRIVNSEVGTDGSLSGLLDLTVDFSGAGNRLAYLNQPYTARGTGTNRWTVLINPDLPQATAADYKDRLIIGMRSGDEIVMISQTYGDSRMTLYKN